MASISGQLEELYMAHSRKDMSDTLTGILMSACAPGTAMPGRLVMEHVLLVSILHRTVGIEVGCRGSERCLLWYQPQTAHTAWPGSYSKPHPVHT